MAGKRKQIGRMSQSHMSQYKDELITASELAALLKQVAERLAVAQSTIYLLCSESRIDHIRVGVGCGAIRINEEALDAFIKGATVKVSEATEAEGTTA